MASPYDNLPADAFWRTAVAAREALDPGRLYQRRFKIHRLTRIVTAGSCFAQHVGAALKAARCTVVDTEDSPTLRKMDHSVRHRFGYGLYAARYGNIYTAAQLLKLLREAFDGQNPGDIIWQHKGRYFDALRPNVEPDGLDSAERVRTHRAHHLNSVRDAFRQVEVFVFTFGLTEAWVSKEHGTIYPTAPGTIAGDYHRDKYEFRNYGYQDILNQFVEAKKIIKELNRSAKFIITTSPVPLTATASGQHVEVANAYSKATLRAVCGTLMQRFRDTDYFPAYEIITSLNSRGIHFAPNQRTVTAKGVETAMHAFLAAHDLLGAPDKPGREPSPWDTGPTSDDDAICEDVLLERFAP